jgi:hemoglobin/transferrin/lactoferrin receptor protein
VAPNNPVRNNVGWDTLTLKYANNQANDQVDIEGTVYYTQSDIDRLGQYRLGTESVGLDLRNTSVLGDHTLTYGLDFRNDRTSFVGQGSVTGFAATLTYATTSPETFDVFGVYVQDKWKLHERWDLGAGFRVDDYSFADAAAQEYDSTGVSPNVSLTYEIAKPLKAYATYAQALRGVNSIDSITRAEGGTVNAADIDAEPADRIEGGLQYDDEKIFSQAAVYRQNIDDVIAAVGGVRDNRGELEVFGYEASIGSRWNDFTASLGVAESFPELNGATLNDNNVGLGTAYARTWNLDLNYAFPEQRLSFGTTMEYQEKFDDVSAGVPAKGSYFVTDIYAQWTPLEGKDLHVKLSVNNLFDKFYSNQATPGFNTVLGRVAGLPEPGRDVRLTLSYQF